MAGPSAEQRRRAGFAECAERLRKLHLALNIYANDHNGAFPMSPGARSAEQALTLLVPKSTSDTSIFICPASGQEVLPQAQPFPSRRISYAYASGLRKSDPPMTPLASDSFSGNPSKSAGGSIFSTDGKGTGSNHEKFGGNVLFLDGHIEQVGPQGSRDLTLPAHAVWLNPKI
jgi:prepilin-type processing-associated H-X9-DG protein